MTADQVRSVNAAAVAAYRRGDTEAALALYGEGWGEVIRNKALAHAVGVMDVLWMGLAILDLLVTPRPDGARYHPKEALAFADKMLRVFRSQVVGHPFFHLRRGQAKAALDGLDHSGPGTALDELTRALIGGGLPIFAGEDPALAQAVTRVLLPPRGYDSWSAAGDLAGAAEERLQDARFHPADILTAKYKRPMGCDSVDDH